MKKMLLAFVMLVVLGIGSGCQTTNSKVSPNMKQSITRSAGDVAMTGLLDSGVDVVKARNYVFAVYSFVEAGTVDKNALRTYAYGLADKLNINNASGYIEGLMSLVPSSIGDTDVIPDVYRNLIVSFLRDGAIRALDLYKVQ